MKENYQPSKQPSAMPRDLVTAGAGTGAGGETSPPYLTGYPAGGGAA